jgi:uncharacterized protein
MIEVMNARAVGRPLGFLRNFLLSVLLLLLFDPIALRAASPVVPSSPPGRVVDLANLIEPALEAQLVSGLRELEEKTTAQMAILTVNSLNGETVEALSLRTAKQWKLGQKGKDNGLLLTVVLKERKYRFETGYGLEGSLPDSLLGSLGREKMVPFFKKGKYGEGIAAATKEVLAVFAKHYEVQLGGIIQVHNKYNKPSKIVQSHHDPLEGYGLYIVLICCGIMLLVVIMLFLPRRERPLYIKRNKSWSRGSSLGSISDSSWTWSSSDSSSSSSSDFSSCGGDFGGSGSSGDW